MKAENVSIVICCFNSASRLPETIKHLMAQKVPDGLKWEVIVVDNASTDNTAQVARSLWPGDAPAPLRIVSEPKPGISHARRRGFDEARYELISFIDDDNWVAPNWVRLVSEIMTAHPEVGACGGQSEAVFETEPPDWFEEHAANFVVGRQGDKAGDVTWSRGNLWGAGLTIRKQAWAELVEKGFQPILSGRIGNKLSSGEDYEICYALRLAGWRLRYSDELAFKHFMPTSRLSIPYLSKLKAGFGAQTIGFDPYLFYVRHQYTEVKTIFGKIWLRQLLREVYISFFRDKSFWKKWLGKREDVFNNQMQWKYHWGRIRSLWQTRRNYDLRVTTFEQNPWICIERQSANYLFHNPDFGDRGNPDLSPDPLVTALICNYNYEDYLAEAVDSALAQTWGNLEVLVVDDGSTDGSRKILKIYEGRIRTILKENGGQASAFNIGIAEARGEIICFLDSDDLWEPDKVEQVVKKYREAAWGLVCHELMEFDHSTYIPGERPLGNNQKGELRAGDVLQYVQNQGYKWIFRPTSAMSVPSHVARKILPIPEAQWRICADNPLAFGSICHAPVGLIKETLGYYRYHGKNRFASTREAALNCFLSQILEPLKRFFFIAKNLSQYGKKLDKFPEYYYRDFRKRVFVFQDKPWRSLNKLISSNYTYHIKDKRGEGIFHWLSFIKFFSLDIIIIILIQLGAQNPYRKLRGTYRDVSQILDSETRKYFSTCFF